MYAARFGSMTVHPHVYAIIYTGPWILATNKQATNIAFDKARLI